MSELTCPLRRFRGPLLALLSALTLSASASAQTYGSWDVPCELGLSPRFSFPFFHGVIYSGKEFLTNWRSITQTTPLPSRNWYEASPERDVVSRDGTARWYGAKVHVHCWIERNPYLQTFHRDPIGFAGLVRPCAVGGGGTEGDLNPYSPESYASGGAETDCGEGGSGAGDEPIAPPDWPGLVEGPGGFAGLVCGGSDVLVYDDLCIEVWVTGVGWTVYWCGVGVTCGEE